jgi:hypothetical protein
LKTHNLINDKEDLGIYGRIILKSILNKYLTMWTGLMWLRTGSSGGLLYTRKLTLGLQKGRQFLDQKHYYLFKRNSVPWNLLFKGAF